MERLTTNKPVSEMGMLELAHNCCYVKDRNARYRDFEMDMDARELTRQLLKDHAQDDDAFILDEDFDEWMIDYLQNGIDTTEGLIALFYRNLWAMAELSERLKAYEDAEEQGLLLRLPCKVGDTVYLIRTLCDGKETKVIEDFVVCYFVLRESRKLIVDEDGHGLEFSLFGETVFLTKEEAEQKLEEMKGEV